MSSKKFQIEFLNKLKDSVVNKFKSVVESPSQEEGVSLEINDVQALGLNKAKVIYYKTFEKFEVYRVVSYSDEECYSICNSDLNGFLTLDYLESYYESIFKEVEFINLLSVDYVYLYNSGVCVEGLDLRTPEQILNDSFVHCLYVNKVMNEVLVHNEVLTCKFYRPFDGNYNEKNLEGWSYSIVDDYLKSGRIKIFLSSDNLYEFHRITKAIRMEPDQLLIDLQCTCVSTGTVFSHCGNLGVQIS